MAQTPISHAYLMEVYKETAEAQIKNSYSQYKDYYKSISLDMCDVISTAQIKIIECLRDPQVETLPQVEMYKYIGQSIHNMLLDLIGSAIRDTIVEDIYLFTHDSHLSPLEIINTLPNLTQFEYTILVKKFVDGKSYSEIAHEEDAPSAAKIRNVYAKIFKKHAKCSKGHLLNTRLSDTAESWANSKVVGENDLVQVSKEARKVSDDLMSEKEPEILFDQIRPHLSELQYTIVVKIFQEGFEVREVADELNLAKSVVWDNYQKALKKLKKIVKK